MEEANKTLKSKVWPPTLREMADGFAVVEAQTIRVADLWMSQETFNSLVESGKEFDFPDRDKESGAPTWWGANVHVTDLNPSTEVYFVGESESDPHRENTYTACLVAE